MKQKHILKYFISCCFILSTCIIFGQKKGRAPKEKKTDPIAKTSTIETDSIIVYEKNYGLRIGIDLVKPVLTAVKENYKGIEIVADYRLKKNLYIAAEIGVAEQDTRRDTYAFTASGSYISAGINRNLFKNWLEMDNEVYVGARYGFSVFDQTVDEYFIFQEGTSIDGISGSYFEPKTNTNPKTYENLTAHWMGLVFGLKVEIFKNLYLGGHIQFNFMLAQTQPDNFQNLYVPGFNKVYSSGTGMSYGYTISYRVPLYKK
ncbi:DUF6048 family protein [Flavicella sp.]|uniref:DUF6048 family protein n=1 Tax=Flavicella sp. TaxID=2957742 RepID=UPI003019606E